MTNPKPAPSDLFPTNLIEDALKERFGERCADFDPACIGCLAWAELHALKGAALVQPAPTHRHKKRGSEYVLIGIGKMQAEYWREHGLDKSWPTSVDMREVAIYRDVKDGSLWARPREEFEDGRFEALSTTGGRMNGEADEMPALSRQR